MGTTALDDVRLLRPRQAAALLDISPRQLDRLVEAGVVQPVRLVPNGNRRFRVRDLAALVADTTKEN